MTLRRKILAGVATLLAIFLVTLAALLSHDSPCSAPAPLAEGVARMKAWTQRCYGSPAVLKLEDIARPTVADDEILVKVQAAAVNPVDWHYMRGKPYFMRLSSGLGLPNDTSVGVDFSGTVEAVGKSVTRFKPGDAVFGGKGGALAEYIAVRETRAVVLKPATLTFEQAGAITVAATTALQGLRDNGQIKAGQRVLINGASGGVGTFAVQIAKAFGADVTGVCSTRNVELVKSLGADRVIDYTKQNFTELPERYDLILDNVGNHPLLDVRGVLKPGGILVMVGGESRDPWLGPLLRPIRGMFISPFVKEKLLKFYAHTNQDDLAFLAELAAAGKLTTVIDRTYALQDAAEAIAYLETGRARGKVVVSMQ